MRQQEWEKFTQGPSTGVGMMVTYGKKVIVVGINKNYNQCGGYYAGIDIILMTPDCSAGNFSLDWSHVECQPCPKGQYSQKGSTHCFTCGQGMEFASTKPASLSDCICLHGCCNEHGSCSVLSNESSATAVCHCHTGFSGTRCEINYLLFIYIGSGVAFIIIALFTTLIIRKCINYKKKQKLAEEELDIMRKVWSIGHDEIILQHHVATGGFGDVVKARYREMAVVVKKLHECLRWVAHEEEDFEKEIALMQAIRHPNIVLFLGAGRDQNGIPFLVLEYVTRGSLRKILDDSSVDLTQGRRISFVLDTAKGMRFLHSLKPSRIHRDLKCLNLLVSQDWTVKVADFGTARIIKPRWAITLRNPFKALPVRCRKRNEEGLQNSCETSPLLTSNVGTLLWQAPETIGHNTRYGKPADVYRYDETLR